MLKLPLLSLCLLLPLGCVEGNSDPNTSGTDATAAPGSPTVAWSADTPTTSVPTYGKNCRYAAETLFESPSNGQPDDTISLSEEGSNAGLSFQVTDKNGVVLKVEGVTLERGLLYKSFRNATGQATWGLPNQTANIVDGTLCFSEKLDGNNDVQAEFSLVMETAPGTFESLSGSFFLPGTSVNLDPLLTIQSSTLDVSLD